MATKRRTKAERELAAQVEQAVLRGIYEGLETHAEDWRRDHMGASLIGHKCDRYLWLNFRWALNPEHSGKQIRLFRRGDLEEVQIVDDIRRAGLHVKDTAPDGNQWRVKWGHFGGSCDGIAQNVPGLDPDEPVLLEFKTYSAKSFAYLQSKGVRSAKPEHFAQMQVYMHGMRERFPGLKRCLYIAVHKDTDELYVQLVDYDETHARKMIDRARHLITETTPPPRMDKDAIPCVYVSKDGTRWPCDYFDLCHGQAMPERNCRTCVSSTPKVEHGVPGWVCDELLVDFFAAPGLTSERQRKGCDQQCSIPPIVNARVADVRGRTVTYQFDDGTTKTEGVER